MVKISDRLDIEQVSEPSRLRTILVMNGHYLHDIHQIVKPITWHGGGIKASWLCTGKIAS